MLVTITNIGGKVFTTFTHILNSAWIIDFGATYHMTFDIIHVSNIKTSSQNYVSTTNDNTIPFIVEGSSHLIKILNHGSMLIVPSLDYNLLSVSQIATFLFCVVIFWHDHCVFKGIQTRQFIDYGIKKGKLYYLDLESRLSNKLQQALVVTNSGSSKKIT